MPERAGRTKTFPVGLTDEARASYQAAADSAGVSLAQWIRDACELRLGKAVAPADAARVSPPTLGATSFKGPDPKPSERKKPDGEEKPKGRRR